MSELMGDAAQAAACLIGNGKVPDEGSFTYTHVDGNQTACFTIRAKVGCRIYVTYELCDRDKAGPHWTEGDDLGIERYPDHSHAIDATTYQTYAYVFTAPTWNGVEVHILY